MNFVSNAWIFISYSTHDLPIARRIRNYLEERGANPILLFLKSMNDEGEIDGLIKREIEARSFFLLLDSHPAQNSRWVREETFHALRLGAKRLAKIDVNCEWDKVTASLDLFLRSATVTLSGYESSERVAAPFRDAFLEADFGVEDIPIDANNYTEKWARIEIGHRWNDALRVSAEQEAIRRAGTGGAHLHFVSDVDEDNAPAIARLLSNRASLSKVFVMRHDFLKLPKFLSDFECLIVDANISVTWRELLERLGFDSRL